MNTSSNVTEHDTRIATNNSAVEFELSQPPQWLDDFISVYQRLSTDNLDLLNTIYDKNITFIDPIHEIKGFDQLASYFDGLYKNLASCDFIIERYIQQGNEASLFWKMTYRHPKLNKGKEVVVYGTSNIKAKNGKVIYHRDFLDLGAMLYEQLPVLGRIIKWIKVKAAANA
jgi:hypothetical protein